MDRHLTGRQPVVTSARLNGHAWGFLLQLQDPASPGRESGCSSRVRRRQASAISSRDGAQMIVAERPYGTFTRQVFLVETLDADHIAADYAAGVLTLTIPVREAAKPRSFQVTCSDTKQAVTA